MPSIVNGSKDIPAPDVASGTWGGASWPPALSEAAAGEAVAIVADILQLTFASLAPRRTSAGPAQVNIYSLPGVGDKRRPTP